MGLKRHTYIATVSFETIHELTPDALRDYLERKCRFAHTVVEAMKLVKTSEQRVVPSALGGDPMESTVDTYYE